MRCCSCNGGNGSCIFFIVGTVNCGILDPSDHISRQSKQNFIYFKSNAGFGTIVISLTIGTNGIFLIHVKPIVPLADTVKHGSITLAAFVYPYNPSFSTPLAYMGMMFPFVFSLVNSVGLSPPANTSFANDFNVVSHHPFGSLPYWWLSQVISAFGLIRLSSSLAGSSFGSCGTSLP